MFVDMHCSTLFLFVSLVHFVIYTYLSIAGILSMFCVQAGAKKGECLMVCMLGSFTLVLKSVISYSI